MTEKKMITAVSEVGEFGLIERITKNFTLSQASTLKGVGDDAAVLRYGNNLLVMSTDILMEGIHFNLVYTPLKHLGYKAVTVNLSDIYAMNAMPRQITMSIAFSGKFSVEAIEELYEGARLACEKYGVDMVGGDTASSMTGLVISITAIGEVEEDKVAYRGGAKKNDIICVSGNLGASYMGLQLLEREKKMFEEGAIQPDLQGYAYVLQRQLKPEARGDMIDLLNQKGIVPTAMIDVSDGLSSELLHICKASDVGCKVFMEKIPIDAETATVAEEFNLEPEVCALNGGEDYELLFTVSLADYEKIKDVQGIAMIGHITDASLEANLVTRQGNFIPIRAQGWNHHE